MTNGRPIGLQLRSTAVDVTNGSDASEVSRTFVVVCRTKSLEQSASPSSLHELTYTQTFKRQLKTFLFQQALQYKEQMSAVLKPTFYVVLFSIVFTIFNSSLFLLGLYFIRLNRWSVLS